MKYIVFLTVNLKNNKVYIGTHGTGNPDIFDGYLGSGVFTSQPSTFMYPKNPLQFAVKKYGTASFKRFTLFVYDNLKSARQRKNEIVDEYFMNQKHVYNYEHFKDEIFYQFDLNGNLKKDWVFGEELCEFYGYPIEKFRIAAKRHRKFLNSYWSYNKKLDMSTVNNKQIQCIYLYNKEGILKGEYENVEEVSNFTGVDSEIIRDCIKTQRPYQMWYFSNAIRDEFYCKPRKQLSTCDFYVYKDNEFVGKYHGKEVMRKIDLYSWNKLSNVIERGWYKDFFISLQPVEQVPEKVITPLNVDVYNKYGDFIETLSIKDLKDKYNIKSSVVKNIMKGDKYVNDYIFKYHSNK